MTYAQARLLKVGDKFFKPGYKRTLIFWVTKLRKGGINVRIEGARWYLSTDESLYVTYGITQSFWDDCYLPVPPNLGFITSYMEGV